MFKTMLQLSLIAAGIGLAKAGYDNGTLNFSNGLDFQPVIAAIRQFANATKNSGTPGSQNVANGAETAITAIQNLDIAKNPSNIQSKRKGAVRENNSSSNTLHAFYKSTPEKCAGELTIDFQTGIASCTNPQSR
ncbi:MAG: hypothetical protein ACYC0M_10685 [Burkholderiales bacterium]